MLLDDLGHDKPGARVREAVAAALLDPAHHTADLGGRATTTELGSAVLSDLEEAQ
jgi:tartrate dehydrogenase/decarboxylase/D-malate dehydrogenase